MQKARNSRGDLAPPLSASFPPDLAPPLELPAALAPGEGWGEGWDEGWWLGLVAGVGGWGWARGKAGARVGGWRIGLVAGG